MQRIETPTKYVEVILDNGVKVEWAETITSGIHLFWSLPNHSGIMYENTFSDKAENLIEFLSSFSDFESVIIHSADSGIELDIETGDMESGVILDSELSMEFLMKVEGIVK